MNRRRNRAALVTSVLLLLPLAPGLAVAQSCAGACASELTQLLNWARLVDQLATQGKILTTNTNQFANMTTNTTPWASLSWGNGQANITAFNQVLSGSGSLSYASPSLLSLFNSQNQTYTGYLGTPATSATAAAKYQQWSTTTNSSVLSALQAGQLQSTQITGDELSTINGYKTNTQTVQGNLAGLQLLAQIGLTGLEFNQKTRQDLLALTSVQANAIQVQSDKDTQIQAAWRTFLNTNPNIATTGGTRF